MIGSQLIRDVGRRAASIGFAGCLGQLVHAMAGATALERGAAVHIQLPGFGPLDGVVEYLAPTSVGVRTADALVRFHGRAAIGMTTAVSHHAYGKGFDALTTASAWKSWLGAAFTECRRPQ